MPCTQPLSGPPAPPSLPPPPLCSPPPQVCDGNPHSKWLDFGGQHGDLAWLEYRLPNQRPPVALASYALTSANDSPERDPAHWVLEALVEGQAQEGQGEEGQALGKQVRERQGQGPAEGEAEGEGPTPGPVPADTAAAAAAAAAAPSGSAAANDAAAAGAASGAVSGAPAPATWVPLDEQQGVAFPGRHVRLQFELPPAARAVAARRWRLRIVSVANPAAANSVQLACWDLYAESV
jgi:hypothetical protein